MGARFCRKPPGILWMCIKTSELLAQVCAKISNEGSCGESGALTDGRFRIALGRRGFVATSTMYVNAVTYSYHLVLLCK
jgi:hypothetical protein